MSLDLIGTIKAVREERAALVQQRQQIDQRLAVIDGEMNEVRRLLEMAVPLDETARVLHQPVPELLQKTCEVCQLPYVRTSPVQRMCPTCREEQPHVSVERMTGTAEPDGTCAYPPCSKPFVRAYGTGTDTRYCSRDCYRADLGTPERDAAILAALDKYPRGIGLAKLAIDTEIVRETLRGRLAVLRDQGQVVLHGVRGAATWHRAPNAATPAAALAPAPADAPIPVPEPPSTPEPASRSVYDTPLPIPKRRCARCVKPFQPTRDREYICPACLGKKAAIGPAPAIGTPLANESVTARDMAILRALQNGPRDEGQLVATISGIGTSDLQMALRRLEMREKIIRQGERWRLV